MPWPSQPLSASTSNVRQTVIWPCGLGIGKILASARSHRLMFQPDLPAGVCGSYVLHQSAAQSRHLAQLAGTMTDLPGAHQPAELMLGATSAGSWSWARAS